MAIKPKRKKPSCWKGYVAKGKKKSPSGKRDKNGKIKMVNNCVKIKKKKWNYGKLSLLF